MPVRLAPYSHPATAPFIEGLLPEREGVRESIAREDLCQATATPPRRKYESDGGPSAPSIVATLRAGGAGEESVHRFLEGVILNAVLGAPDAHAKNYSILLAPGVVELAPLYDVASSLPYDRRKGDGLGEAAMAIGGVRAFGRVEERHWIALAEECRVAPDWPLAAVRRISGAVPDALADVVARHAGVPGVAELAPRLLDRVAHLCATTAAHLGG
ncbi:MAG: type II toxin-antitoxin system HipA family toxin [Actinobacteria bacterium]|nr:type II toxin-antitoxin system HipA family toxin [Actinomycetota bacterium]